jgi:hypothetical protein
MPAATNTTGVSFVFNNTQASAQASVANNTNAVLALPTVLQLEPQSATSLTGRQAGGLAYRTDTNGAWPYTNGANASIMLDGFEIQASRLTGSQIANASTKSGCFFVTLSGTNAVTVPLTNTQTNTNGVSGDTIFTKYVEIILYNLSGLDGNNSASMTVGPAATNGNKLQMPLTNSTLTVDGSSAHILKSVNSVAINAANAAITITPTANSTFACVLVGG